jgi:hypothetical protein
MCGLERVLRELLGGGDGYWDIWIMHASQSSSDLCRVICFWTVYRQTPLICILRLDTLIRSSLIAINQSVAMSWIFAFCIPLILPLSHYLRPRPLEVHFSFRSGFSISTQRHEDRHPYAVAAFAACCGFTFLPSLLYLILGGGARFRRPSRDRTRTILPWMAHETQYWSLRYILGTA